jgi:hypothetical protein
MMRLAMLLVLAGAVSFAQERIGTELPSVTRAGFGKLRLAYHDGITVDIFTQSSVIPLPVAKKKKGEPWVGTVGTLVVWRDGVHRIVMDKDGAIVFGYDLAAVPGQLLGTVTIRITPLGRGFEAALRSGSLEVEANGKAGKVPVGQIPTVAAVREFPSLTRDLAVTMDILYNPSTGEKVFEVLIPSVGKPDDGKEN